MTGWGRDPGRAEEWGAKGQPLLLGSFGLEHMKSMLDAHNRGLELHVWLNPYRSHHKVGGPVTDSSIVKRKPQLNVFLKDGYWWFDPSLKEMKEKITDTGKDKIK